MKLSKELLSAIKKELNGKLPDYPEDIELNDDEITITGICIDKKDSLFIGIEEE